MKYILKVNDMCCIRKEWKQKKFPKSKKKRIRNKWSKDTKYYGLVDVHSSIIVGDIIYVSQKIYTTMMKAKGWEEIKHITEIEGPSKEREQMYRGQILLNRPPGARPLSDCPIQTNKI